MREFGNTCRSVAIDYTILYIFVLCSVHLYCVVFAVGPSGTPVCIKVVAQKCHPRENTVMAVIPLTVLMRGF